jgi:hypothetical protein
MGKNTIYQRRISIWMIMYTCIINRSAIISAIPYAEPNNVPHNTGWLAMDWHTLYPNTGLNIPQSDPLQLMTPEKVLMMSSKGVEF